MPTNETRRIIITANAGEATSAINSLAKQMGQMSQNTKQLANDFGLLKQASAFFFGALSIKSLFEFSDEIANLNNRLVVVTGSQEKATATLAELAAVSRSTNQSISATGEIYAKLSQSLQSAGLKQETLLELTETLQNTFRLSGKSAEDAAKATSQLALAFELGGLKGRELRAVLRQNTVFANLLRKEFGGELASAARNGFLDVATTLSVLHKNADAINSSAQKLNTTFGQDLTKVLDAFKLKVFELSTAMGVGGAFDSAAKFMIANMNGIIVAMTFLSATAIPRLFTALSGIFASINPITIAIAALAAGLVAVSAVFANHFDFKYILEQMRAGFANLQADVDILLSKIYEFAGTFTKLLGPTLANTFTNLGKAAAQSAKDHEVHAKAILIEAEAHYEYDKQLKAGKITVKDFAGEVDKLNKSMKPDLTVDELLSRINKEYSQGRLSVKAYNEEILKFDIASAKLKFRDGKEDLLKLNEAYRKVEIADINRKFEIGALTINEFNSAIRNVNLNKLNEELATGKVSLADYNSKLAAVSDQYSTQGAFRTGLQDYVNAIGTTTQQVATLIKGTFDGLDNYFLEFIKTGKFNFEKFTQSILDDLTRIIIRSQIVTPLAQGLLSFVTPTASTPGTAVGGGGGQYGSPNIAGAHGLAFDKGIRAFASGGIVDSPTLFGHKGGVGLMGEAGTEAILPLKRGSGGDLGVKATVTPVTVNVINQSGNEVKQTQTSGPNGEKTLEILITGKVREGIASGKFDKILGQAYGLNRRGS